MNAVKAIRRILGKLKTFYINHSVPAVRYAKSATSWGAGNKEEYLRLFHEKNEICIVGTKFTSYVVDYLADYFERRGVVCHRCYSPISKFKDLPYIIISPLPFVKLPPISHYIAFQMEQTISDRWLTKAYLEDLNNAAAVFDYSEKNISYLKQRLNTEMQYVPVGYIDNTDDGECFQKEYDVVFYGDYKSERRIEFLDELKKHFNVTVLYELYGEDLYAALRRAKVAVNIHYYENALLETTRIYELLSLGMIIVSEKSSDFSEDERVRNVVDFVDVGDISAMCERVEYWLNDDDARADKSKTNREWLKDLPSVAAENLDAFFGVV